MEDGLLQKSNENYTMPWCRTCWGHIIQCYYLDLGAIFLVLLKIQFYHSFDWETIHDFSMSKDKQILGNEHW